MLEHMVVPVLLFDELPGWRHQDTLPPTVGVSALCRDLLRGRPLSAPGLEAVFGCLPRGIVVSALLSPPLFSGCSGPGQFP